jgi:heme/copper-type cytochrome/quinol oxidase subunit 4
MEPTKVYPIVALLSLITVEYGGWALLSFISSRRGQLSDFQTTFFRAGHAHAGVLLVLSLVYFLYLGSRTDFAESTQWVAGAILLAGVLAQSGGFFLHMGLGDAGRASVGTRLTRSGALLIATALVILVVGIARA